MTENVRKLFYYVGLIILSIVLFIFYKKDTLMATMLLGFTTEKILEFLENILDLENSVFFKFRICIIAGILAVAILPLYIFIKSFVQKDFIPCLIDLFQLISLFVATYFIPYLIGLFSCIESQHRNSLEKIMQKGFLRAIVAVIVALIGILIEKFFPNLKIEEYLSLEYFFSFFFMAITDILKDLFRIE